MILCHCSENENEWSKLASFQQHDSLCALLCRLGSSFRKIRKCVTSEGYNVVLNHKKQWFVNIFEPKFDVYSPAPLWVFSEGQIADPAQKLNLHVFVSEEDPKICPWSGLFYQKGTVPRPPPGADLGATWHRRRPQTHGFGLDIGRFVNEFWMTMTFWISKMLGMRSTKTGIEL